MSPKLFIYGSCVSRDIVRVTRNRFEVSYYVARQTFASSFSPPLPTPNDLSGLKHNFDKRSVTGDITSNLGQMIRRWGPESDAVIVDIATEHWGVVPVNGTTHLTHSRELSESRYLETVQHGSRIDMGSPRHFRLFTIGADKLYRQLENLDLLKKTLILRTPFATHTTNNDQVPLSKGRTSNEWEPIQIPYYEYLSNLGFNISPPPPANLIISTDEHQWGPALYHYVDDSYYWWADQIDDFIKSNN